MKRVTRRSIALVLAVVACKGDPTGDLRNGVDHLIATPSAIFLSGGLPTNVLIEAVDEQGNREGTTFSLGTVSPIVDVVVDTTFGRIVNNAGDLVFPDKPTRLRYSVSPVAPTGSGSFTVRAGGHEITVPVRLVPDSVNAALSSATPAAGDTVTLTLAAPFQLRDGASADIGGTHAITIDQTATTLRVVPLPGGTNGPVTVNGVALDYATTLSLSLPSLASIASPTGKTGTGSVATAPTVGLPATAADTVILVDLGEMSDAVASCEDDIGGTCRVYKVVLAAGGVFHVLSTWEGASDLGIYVLNSAGVLTVAPGFCDAHGANAGNQPEECNLTLGAGTFYLAVANFSAADPVWVRLDISR